MTPAGEEMWQRRGQTWVARFGTSRFKGIAGIYGAVGAATYEVTYGDEIEVLRSWRGAGGKALADDRLTGELTTTLYRYVDRWRVHVN